MIYLDNNATTPLDPVALEAMLPFFKQQFANPGSVTHQAGRQVAEDVQLAIARIANSIGAEADELVITSGATESNNLALQGVMHHPRNKRRKIVSVATEHKAILDPLKRLAQQGFEVELLTVQIQNGSGIFGQVEIDRLADAIDDSTALVSVMLANNEIGVIQPLLEISKLCRQHACWLHTDATQAVGQIEVNVDDLGVDLLSFSAHKFYGPKGVGGLFVRRRERPVRMQGQILGGGQQNNWRSGTLNSAGIVGMQAALQNTLSHLDEDRARVARLRNRLFARLSELPQIFLNGPPLQAEHRLSGNLNCCFYPLEGQSLMLHTPELAISSGSACTSASPEPSHVLRAIGLTEDQARSSLRLGIGRFNTDDEVELAADMLVSTARRFLDASQTGG